MARLITGEKLKACLDIFMDDAMPEHCKGMKYDFALSKRFLKAKFGNPVNYDDLSPKELREGAVVSPGEVVYVMTEETLHLPENIHANLTPKRNMGERGINVNCALIVDPGYKGKLIFGFYNYSSNDFTLMPGVTFASAVFYEISEEERFKYPEGKQPKPIFDFPPELISTIAQCEPIGFKNLSTKVERINQEIKDIKEALDDNERWVKDVKKIIGDTTDRIDLLSQGLEKEIRARKQEYDLLEKKYETFKGGFDGKMVFIKALGLVISTVVVGGGGALLIAYITGHIVI